jgi:outer membrane receptor protein involved in Fe transport
VERDQQSVLDEQYGTHASLAPGNMKGDAYRWDAQLTMKYKGFKFDGKFIDRKRDMPFGDRPILDNMSNLHPQEYYLNLSYDATITEGLDLMAKVYRNQNSYSSLYQYWPKGSWFRTPAGPMITSEKRFGEWEGKNRRTGAEAQATYEIVDANTIVGGITFEEQRVYDNTGKANYMPTSTSGVYIPLPSVQDWPDEYVFPTKERNVWAVYVEDLWDIMEDLRLTIGGRYDHYSDCGGEISPRVGINWEFARNFNTKFLYGRAFRAPSFNELYHREQGNPNLKPETENSYELSLGAGFFPFTGQVTVFYKEIKNYVGFRYIDLRYKLMSLGELNYKGVTLQMKYDFGRGTYLAMNYTQLSGEVIMGPEALFPGKRFTDFHWYEPKRLGTLMANVRLNRYLNLNTYLLYKGGWHRPLTDPRDDPGDYVLLNAGLIAKNFLKELKGLEVRGMVYNLFNKDYTSPSGPDELPDNVPMPGINFFLELRYTF